MKKTFTKWLAVCSALIWMNSSHAMLVEVSDSSYSSVKWEFSDEYGELYSSTFVKDFWTFTLETPYLGAPDNNEWSFKLILEHEDFTGQRVDYFAGDPGNITQFDVANYTDELKDLTPLWGASLSLPVTGRWVVGGNIDLSVEEPVGVPEPPVLVVLTLAIIILGRLKRK